MSKIVYCGLESSGKTLKLAQIITNLAKRNEKWLVKYGFVRKIYTNLKLNPTFLEKYQDIIVEWQDVKDVINKTGCDIIWDEISSDFSALKKEPLPKTVNRWLRQGAKQGVHIYATAQEFHDIHLDFRRRVKRAYTLRKMLGSKRGGENLPKIKFIWGVCMLRELKLDPYSELVPEYIGGLPSFLLISKKLCNVFDTHQLILASEELPLEHRERHCPVCGYTKIWHT